MKDEWCDLVFSWALVLNGIEPTGMWLCPECMKPELIPNKDGTIECHGCGWVSSREDGSRP